MLTPVGRIPFSLTSLSGLALLAVVMSIVPWRFLRDKHANSTASKKRVRSRNQGDMNKTIRVCVLKGNATMATGSEKSHHTAMLGGWARNQSAIISLRNLDGRKVDA
jgi:hypothetical protein